MAEGVPVVSSDVPGPSGVIVNGKNGLLVPRNNLKAMVDAILKMYENEELRKRLSAEGTKVSKVFSWDSTTSKIEATYEQARAAHQKQRRLEATEAIE
jgi:glycosyltransferase involved in cell wall biosynthesis